MNTLKINDQEIYQIIMSVGKIEILTESGETAYTIKNSYMEKETSAITSIRRFPAPNHS